MSLASPKILALGAVLLLSAGLAAYTLGKRHERRLGVAGALAAAAVQSHVSSATGLNLGSARGIRIPFYEGEAAQPTSVMLGRTATPLDGGRYRVTDLRVEHYERGPAGTATNLVIEAPDCIVDPNLKVASSAGLFVLSMRQGGNELLTRGSTGFEWRQISSSLNVSNEVTTHLSLSQFKPPSLIAP